MTMTAFDRSALMDKFRAMAARGEPIVGGGAGVGLSQMRGSGRRRPYRHL
jgi:predicted TIM-barrel enzyme